VVGSGLIAQLAEQIPRTVKPQDNFLSLRSALGNLHATGQQESDPGCWTAFGENGGMALELRFLRIGYDGSAIGTRNLRESFEALDRVHPPFEDTGDPRNCRSLLNCWSDGQMPDCSIRGGKYSSHNCRLTHGLLPLFNSQGIRCSLSCGTPTCLQ
jgi:hypothetical protein